MKYKFIKNAAAVMICLSIAGQWACAEMPAITSVQSEKENDVKENISGVSSKYVEILSYELRNAEDNQGIKQIYPGSRFTLRIVVRDSRINEKDLDEALKYIAVSAIDNVFETESVSMLSDAQAEEIGIPGCYTLIFRLKYTGSGNTLKFHLFYRGAFAALKMDEVCVSLEKCCPRQNSDIVEENDHDGTSSGTLATGDIPVSEVDSENNSGENLIMTQLMVTSYDTGEYLPSSGEKFTLNLAITASNGSYDVENIKVALDLNDKLYLRNESSVLYIPRLGRGQTAEICFELEIDQKNSQNQLEVPITITGITTGGTSLETADNLVISLRREPVIEIVAVEQSEYVNMAWDDGSGDTLVSVKNTGNGEADVHLSVTGEKAVVDTDELLVEPNETKTFKIKFTPETEGTKQVTLTLTYEDSMERILEITKQISFTAEKKEAEISHNIAIDKDIVKEKETIPVWVWIVAGTGIVSGTVTIIHHCKRRHSDWKT